MHTNQNISFKFKAFEQNPITRSNKDYIQNYEDTICDKNELREIHKRLQKSRIPGEIKWHLNQKHCEIVDAIEKVLDENNKKYFRYPNDYTHCRLSLDVYRDSIKVGDKLDGLTHWKVLLIFEYKECHIFSVLYINEKRGQLVLAHRGYRLEKYQDFFNKKQTDALSVFLNETIFKTMHVQQYRCYETARKANEIAKERHFFLSFTGYSNGARLAEYCNFFSFQFLENKNTKAVLFDSPGNIYNLNKINDDDNVCNKFNPSDLNQVNYLTAPCFLNSIDHHVGPIYRIFVDVDFAAEKVSGFKGDFVKKLINSKFVFNGIVALFDYKVLKEIVKKFDRSNGKPFYYEEIKHWPRIHLETFEGKISHTVTELLKPKIELILSHCPVPDFANAWAQHLLSFFVRLTSWSLNKWVPPFTLLCNVSVRLMKGDIDVSHFEETSFYMRLREIKNLQQNEANADYNGYSMKIVKRYEPICDMTKKEVWELFPLIGNIDWCLIRLKTANLSKKSHLIMNIYNDLIERYEIISKSDGKNLDKFLKVKKPYYETIIEKMARLNQLCPDIDAFFDSDQQVI